MYFELKLCLLPQSVTTNVNQKTWLLLQSHLKVTFSQKISLSACMNN